MFFCKKYKKIKSKENKFINKYPLILYVKKNKIYKN